MKIFRKHIQLTTFGFKNDLSMVENRSIGLRNSSTTIDNIFEVIHVCLIYEFDHIRYSIRAYLNYIQDIIDKLAEIKLPWYNATSTLVAFFIEIFLLPIFLTYRILNQLTYFSLIVLRLPICIIKRM